MSQRDATRSLSATSLGNNNNNGRANTDIPIMQSFKRGRQHLEPEVPTITLQDVFGKHQQRRSSLIIVLIITLIILTHKQALVPGQTTDDI